MQTYHIAIDEEQRKLLVEALRCLRETKNLPPPEWLDGNPVQFGCAELCAMLIALPKEEADHEAQYGPEGPDRRKLLHGFCL